MCLQINSEVDYSFLGIKNIVDEKSHFAMLGMKEFNVVEGKTKDEVKLHSGIMSNYQYYFAKTKYGIKSLNDNAVQEIKLLYNVYFNNGIKGNAISERTYIKKRMGYHISAFKTDKRYDLNFFDYNKIYIYKINLKIPVMFFYKDIQMISGDEAVIKNFTILEPKILQTVLTDSNLDKLLIWEGNKNFIENYKIIYEKLINNMQTYTLGE